MSESEQKGRLRREIAAAYEGCSIQPNKSDWLIADAIDRLAADVAVIEAKVNDIMPEDVRHFVESEKAWVALVTEQRDAAIRERDECKEEARLAVVNRDEARAEVARLRGEVEDSDRLIDQLIVGNEALARERDEARAEVERLRQSRDAADRLNGATLAEVERLKAELAARQADGNSPGIPDSSPTAPQPAAPPPGWLTEEERELLSLLKDTADSCSMVHRPWRCNWPYSRMSLVVNALLTRAGSPPSQTAPWWLTDEERAVLKSHAQSLREQRFALERGGQTLGYSANPGSLKREADIIEALLARAGSPPVVEVPALEFLGAMTGREQGVVLAYRDALDAAGVKWKEVPRE